jgi:hypothetical protein
MTAQAHTTGQPVAASQNWYSRTYVARRQQKTTQITDPPATS